MDHEKDRHNAMQAVTKPLPDCPGQSGFFSGY